ncbi:MAG: LysM peptidoglycan-binding domain-containing protein [Dehalococcoidia bacterium]|nr:LysM peptidoglycan-binding domain-containing protein [Dehalococcoidia bacterium]
MNNFFLKSKIIFILGFFCIACGNDQAESPVAPSNNPIEPMIEKIIDQKNIIVTEESQVVRGSTKKEQVAKEVVSKEEKIIKTKESLFIDHTVVSGDNLWDLGLEYDIDWKYIYWNNIDSMPSPSSIKLGEILSIPKMPVVQHQIKIGETITDIAQYYEVDVQAIIDFEFNSIKDKNNITVSQILYIPNAEIKYYSVTLSFYYCKTVDDPSYSSGDGGNFCEVMRNGQKVYPGAAACAYRFLGQRFRIMNDPLQRTYECADTGNLVLGWHRDIWFNTNEEGWKWLNKVGDTGDIIILD